MKDLIALVRSANLVTISNTGDTYRITVTWLNGSKTTIYEDDLEAAIAMVAVMARPS